MVRISWNASVGTAKTPVVPNVNRSTVKRLAYKVGRCCSKKFVVRTDRDVEGM